MRRGGLLYSYGRKVQVSIVTKRLNIDQAGLAGDGPCFRIDEQRVEDRFPIGIAQRRGAGAFRVGHHSEYITRLITNTCNISQAAIGVGRIDNAPLFITVTIDHLSIHLELVEGLLIGIVPAFAMCDGDLEGLAFISFAAGEYLPGNELLVGIAQQRSGKQVGFAEDLEAVADAEYPTPFSGETGDALHDRAETRDGTAPQVVAVGKSARQDDTVLGSETGQCGILVPKHDHFLSKIVLQRILHVTVTVGTRENHYSEFHRRRLV